jgi:hypothetical protein
MHREDHEQPAAIAEWGWKFHHLGIPVSKKISGEKHIPGAGLYVSGFDTSPFGIEWMRYEEGSPVHELTQSIPHLAFEVRDIEMEIKKHGFNVIYGPQSNTEGIKVAMIDYDGAPVELIEFEKNK